jgi:hypothetical protein
MMSFSRGFSISLCISGCYSHEEILAAQGGHHQHWWGVHIKDLTLRLQLRLPTEIALI